jgi:hypothetical protein
MSSLTVPGPVRTSPDWELDYYSRPILEVDGKKRWELLICSSPEPPAAPPSQPGSGASPFRWTRACPATSVNSVWLREALEAALAEAETQGFSRPRRVRCMRGSMRPMVQRASEGLGIELVASRRCYSLMEWLREREAEVYPLEPGYLAGPLAPPPAPIRSVAVPLPEAVRGESWSWATLPASTLAEAVDWEIGFSGLLSLPTLADANVMVPGIRLFGGLRALAIAGWLAGLEPVRLEIAGNQLVLEAGLEDRWLLATLPEPEARAAAEAFAMARRQCCGLQFIAVQAAETEPRLEGFWILRDLPDG